MHWAAITTLLKPIKPILSHSYFVITVLWYPPPPHAWYLKGSRILNTSLLYYYFDNFMIHWLKVEWDLVLTVDLWPTINNGGVIYDQHNDHQLLLPLFKITNLLSRHYSHILWNLNFSIKQVKPRCLKAHEIIKLCLVIGEYIPSPAINIDISVNVAFTTNKLNAAKSYIDITDCWHVHYKCTKTFQSSLSHYDELDR